MVAMRIYRKGSVSKASMILRRQIRRTLYPFRQRRLRSREADR